jgi:hypothetical protein
VRRDSDGSAIEKERVGAAPGGVRPGPHARGWSYAADARPRAEAVAARMPRYRSFLTWLKAISRTRVGPTAIAMTRTSSALTVATITFPQRRAAVHRTVGHGSCFWSSARVEKRPLLVPPEQERAHLYARGKPQAQPSAGSASRSRPWPLVACAVGLPHSARANVPASAAPFFTAIRVAVDEHEPNAAAASAAGTFNS